MTQALELKPAPNALAGVDMSELKSLAEMAYGSGMFDNLKSANQAGIKILAGKELGFTPIVSLTGIHFFQGRPVVGAGLLASLIKDSGKYEYKVLVMTSKACQIQFLRLFNGKWEPMGVPVGYTIEEAKEAGLASKDVWKKFPTDMLFAACIRQGARRYCADILRGVSTSDGGGEELLDGDVGAANQEAVAVDLEPDAIDAELVEETPAAEEPTTRDETVAAICKDLNDAGDSIKWTPKAIIDYTNQLLDAKFATLVGLSDEQFDKLCLELNDRLGQLTAGAALPKES